jgi:hypothetical protein
MGLFGNITNTIEGVVNNAVGKAKHLVGHAKEGVQLPPVQLYLATQGVPGLNNGSQTLGSGEFAATDVIYSGGNQVATNTNFFDTIVDGFSKTVDTISSIADPINKLGFITGRDSNLITTGPAMTTTGNIGAQETTDSGTITINTGGGQTTEAGSGLINLLNPLLKTIRNNPLTSIGVGGSALSLLPSMGQSRKQRFRTKDVRIARSVYNLMGRDLMQASQILQIEPGQLSAMLLQKLPSPNPAPTAAALRKTKSTIRKLDRMCNLRDEIAKHAKTTTRRRTPMKRATTTLISNK